MSKTAGREELFQEEAKIQRNGSKKGEISAFQKKKMFLLMKLPRELGCGKLPTTPSENVV